MSEQNNGGPAFPIVHPPVQGVTAGGVEFYGLSIRDYFAAKAMNAFLSRDGGSLKQDAEAAYQMADAMLKARG